MKKLITILLLLISFTAFGNPIDDKCKQFVYKSAPVVTADQYICHTQYALAYSFNSKNPIYTVEFLDKSHTGDLPRTNDFRVDPVIAPEHQATPKDYYKSMCNGDRCDKGHMTPFQDFSACAVCGSESFLMDNMVPQASKNNEIIWKNMEVKIREYAANHPAGVYVITGPAYMFTAHTTIGANKVWVPDYLFKIMIDAANM
jgi:endonuclease G, mitochondrial